MVDTADTANDSGNDTADTDGVRYGVRWDAGRGDLDHPLGEPDAMARHEGGLRYCVAVGAAGAPRVLVEVDTAADELVAWRFDDRGRRTTMIEFRVVNPGWMGVVRMAQWLHPDDRRAEFDATSPRCLTTFDRTRNAVRDVRDAADGQAFRRIDPGSRWREYPSFGDWSGLVAYVLEEPVRSDEPPVGSGPVASPDGGRVAPPRLWTMFGPPRRYRDPDGEETEVEAVRAGRVRLTSGRVVVIDPGYLDPEDDPHDDVPPFTVTVPVGVHPVTVAVARDRGGPVVAGCALHVGDGPVASWEPALRPGEDVDDLGPGEFFAVGVDSGTLALCDVDALVDPIRPGGIPWEEKLDQDGSHEWTVVGDPETAANVVVFRSGWGDGGYPVWIGRDAGGAPVAVVVDTLVLTDAEPDS